MIQKGKQWFVVGGLLSIAVGLLHIAMIFIGASAYRVGVFQIDICMVVGASAGFENYIFTKVTMMNHQRGPVSPDHVITVPPLSRFHLIWNSGPVVISWRHPTIWMLHKSTDTPFYNF